MLNQQRKSSTTTRPSSPSAGRPRSQSRTPQARLHRASTTSSSNLSSPFSLAATVPRGRPYGMRACNTAAGSSLPPIRNRPRCGRARTQRCSKRFTVATVSASLASSRHSRAPTPCLKADMLDASRHCCRPALSRRRRTRYGRVPLAYLMRSAPGDGRITKGERCISTPARQHSTRELLCATQPCGRIRRNVGRAAAGPVAVRGEIRCACAQADAGEAWLSGRSHHLDRPRRRAQGSQEE